jgi:trehalose 6-phosphate synthase
MDRLVVVSNRVPLPSQGTQAGGLAVALDGLMETRGGLWFGWSGNVSAEAAGKQPSVVHHAGVDYVTADLTQDEHDRYYSGFSNGVLWPLLHTLQQLVEYDRQDARAYRDVNTRLARMLAPMLHPSDVVWVHDYQMLPMPAALRAAGVRNPIGFFLHIPFASLDVLATVPEMPAMVRDMLAADLIGFQTENDLGNFANAAEALVGCARTYGNALHVPGPGGGRRVRLGVFPVEIEPRSFARMAAEAEHCAASQALDRSLLPGQHLMLAAERLDPTKGLLQRVTGLRTLLEQKPCWRRRVTLLQIAASSRKDVTSYRNLRACLEREAGALNAEYSDADWAPMRLMFRAVDRGVIAGYMRHARVGVVTPLRDGMNLVAKEFVAAQDPADPGVLVLSQFAGAAQQLDAALLVNPYDPDALADALEAALTMPLGERLERWQSLWAAIENRSPMAWGRAFLTALLRAAAAARAPERVTRGFVLDAERGLRAGMPGVPVDPAVALRMIPSPSTLPQGPEGGAAPLN